MTTPNTDNKGKLFSLLLQLADYYSTGQGRGSPPWAGPDPPVGGTTYL